MKKRRTVHNRSVYVIGAPWRDNWVTKEEGFVAGATACPGSPPGTPARCHGFCQRENKLITIITLQRTTSAKTRATAKRRQQHIPPNVSCKAELINKLKAVTQARDLQPFPSLQNTCFYPLLPFTYTLS